MNNKRSPETEEKISNKKQCKPVSHTRDKKLAMKFDLNVTIKCIHGSILYSSWHIFSGIEYFKNMLNSGMNETQRKEITFEYLDISQAELYIDLIMLSYYGSLKEVQSLSLETFIHLYQQAELHQNDPILQFLRIKMGDIKYSIDLYNFNTIYKVLDDNTMALKFVDSMYNKGVYLIATPNIEAPPLDNEPFWTALFDSIKLNRSDAAWILFFRFLTMPLLEKYISMYKPLSNAFSIKSLICLVKENNSPEFVRYLHWVIDKIYDENFK